MIEAIEVGLLAGAGFGVLLIPTWWFGRRVDGYRPRIMLGVAVGLSVFVVLGTLGTAQEVSRCESANDIGCGDLWLGPAMFLMFSWFVFGLASLVRAFGLWRKSRRGGTGEGRPQAPTGEPDPLVE